MTFNEDNVWLSVPFDFHADAFVGRRLLAVQHITKHLCVAAINEAENENVNLRVGAGVNKICETFAPIMLHLDIHPAESIPAKKERKQGTAAPPL